MKSKLQYSSEITYLPDTQVEDHITLIISELSCYNRKIKIEEMLIQCNYNNSGAAKINPFNNLENILTYDNNRHSHIPHSCRILKIDNNGVKSITVNIYHQRNRMCKKISDISQLRRLMKLDGIYSSVVVKMVRNDDCGTMINEDYYKGLSTNGEEIIYYFNYNDHCIKVTDNKVSSVIVIKSMIDGCYLVHGNRTMSNTTDVNHPIWLMLNRFKIE